MQTVRAIVTFALLGCADASPSQSSGKRAFAERFLSERAFRRESLEDSIVDPDNHYSALRLAQYATEQHGQATGWDALDVWNPSVRPVTLDAQADARDTDSNAPVWDGRVPASDVEWLALGERVFGLWPAELDDLAGSFAQDEGARERFGMQVDDRGRVAGLVRVATADGREHAAWSCSGCHARPDANGRLVAGAPAVTLDRGAMSPPMPDGSPHEAWSWGAGRLDVTADGVRNPTAFPDLRATSHQSHLHWEATLVNALPALAVRIETLIIENTHEQLRPPREVAVALALYIESLGEVGEPGDASAEPEGAALFEQHCADCHHADGGSAAPLDVDVVGTDRRAGVSPERGTGRYRIASLWGVADRGRLLHDGSVTDLPALLDPDRLATNPGHPFGLDLTPNQRTALIAFVGTIGE